MNKKLLLSYFFVVSSYAAQPTLPAGIFSSFFITCQLSAMDNVQHNSFQSAFQHVSQGRGSAMVVFQPHDAEDSRKEMFDVVLDFFKDENNIEIKKEGDKNYIGFCVHIPETKKIISCEMFNLDQRAWSATVDWIRCYDINRIASDLQCISNKEHLRFIILNIGGCVANCLNMDLIDQFKLMNIPMLIHIDGKRCDEACRKRIDDRLRANVDEAYRKRIVDRMGASISYDDVGDDLALARSNTASRVIKHLSGICLLGAVLFLAYRMIR